MPFLKPFMQQTHTVPGFRLGPNLPRPFEWGRRVCGFFSSALGVARCGRSAGCVLCGLWAVSAAVCGGYAVGVSVSSRQEQHHKRPHEEPPPSLNNDRVNPSTKRNRSHTQTQCWLCAVCAVGHVGGCVGGGGTLWGYAYHHRHTYK